jgi:hypothetical protein
MRMHGFAGDELVVAEGGGGVRDVLGQHLVRADSEVRGARGVKLRLKAWQSVLPSFIQPAFSLSTDWWGTVLVHIISI